MVTLSSNNTSWQTVRMDSCAAINYEDVRMDSWAMALLWLTFSEDKIQVIEEMTCTWSEC